MRVGFSLFPQNYTDWDRFEALERHEGGQGKPSKSDASVLADDFALASQLEELGFDSLWTVEHHFAPYTMITNPLQILTYFAGRTERLDLGTMVVVLPWHNPVRVAEDAVMLQHLIGEDRKLFLGLGRGLGRREFGGFGLDMDESRERFIESVDIIRLATSQERFSYDGKHYKVPEISLRPQPLNLNLMDNAYCAWGSPQSVPVAASLGLKPLVIPQKPWSEYAGEMETFETIRRENGHGRAKPIIVVYGYCAETEKDARDVATLHYREYADSVVRQYELKGGHFSKLKSYEHYAHSAEALAADPNMDMSTMFIDNHVWGTPERCFAKIEEIRGMLEPSPAEIVLAMKFGSMPFDVANKSMRLFAREVLPAVHALPDADVSEVAGVAPGAAS